MLRRARRLGLVVLDDGRGLRSQPFAFGQDLLEVLGVLERADRTHPGTQVIGINLGRDQGQRRRKDEGLTGSEDQGGSDEGKGGGCVGQVEEGQRHKHGTGAYGLSEAEPVAEAAAAVAASSPSASAKTVGPEPEIPAPMAPARAAARGVAAAEGLGAEMDYDTARSIVYGMPYKEWKAKYQTDQPADRMENFEQHEH